MRRGGRGYGYILRKPFLRLRIPGTEVTAGATVQKLLDAAPLFGLYNQEKV